MSAVSVGFIAGNVGVTSVGSVNILVNPLDLSAGHVLTRLKMQKNKFTKPFFKKPAKLLPSERLASRVIGEVFEREHGEDIAEFIKQIKSNVSTTLHFGNEIPSRIKEVTESLKKGTPKSLSPEFMQEIRERAKLIESQTTKRTAAVIKIQSYWRMILAILRVSDIRMFKRAAKRIKRFLGRLAARTRRINKGLEILRLHFWASIITRFMRKSHRIMKARRVKSHREGLIRAVLSGIKARMIFNIPRMQETKLLVKNLISQQPEMPRNSEEARHLMDEIKYQKNLYINLFYKYWSKRISVLEELAKENRERENRKKRTSVNADTSYQNPRGLRKAPSIQANIDGGMNQSRSKVNSRAPSMDIEEPSRSGSLALLTSNISSHRHQGDHSALGNSVDERPIKPMGNKGPVNLDDRPIKPMGAGGFSGVGSSGDLDFPGDKVRRNSKGPRENSGGAKRKEKPNKSEEANDRVKKQRELVDKRRKYDPRKALQGANAAESEKSTDNVETNNPRIKIKGHKNKEELENIAENLNEERSLNGFPDDIQGEHSATGNRFDKPKKEFLKRKTKKVEFHKVDWSNVQGRTDCWGIQKEESVPKLIKKEPAKLSTGAKLKQQVEPDPDEVQDTSNPTTNARDLSMIRLKSEDPGRAPEAATVSKAPTVKKPAKSEKKDGLQQIEDTLSQNYLPKLAEVLQKEVLRDSESRIPVLHENTMFSLFVEEQDLQTVLQQLEDEYDFLINN